LKTRETTIFQFLLLGKKIFKLKYTLYIVTSNKKMELFKKKEKKEENVEEIPKFPDIPKLPELPDFETQDDNPQERISQLPSFPNGSLGNKFSQYSIKNAVTGKKEEEEDDADEFGDEEEIGQKMQPLLAREEPRRSYPMETMVSKPKDEEARFIRIDKFEESSKAFEEVKKQSAEIEKMFGDLKKIKDEEEKEMEIFESEIKKIKEKIENIDKNIFYNAG
jgi:hypothetical protein